MCVCASLGEAVNLSDAPNDERWHAEFDTITGYHTKACLCVPVKESADGETIAIMMAINQKRGNGFSSKCVVLVTYAAPLKESVIIR